MIALLLLCLAAAFDFAFADKVRRTFAFVSFDGGKQVIEERMLPKEKTKELSVTKYVYDVILGPSSLEVVPLVNQGTMINSVFMRDNIVYIDLSESAAIPPLEGGVVLENFKMIKKGVLRNFRFIKDVFVFIEGNEVARN
ncbi:MAG: hypothetical protein Ta2G_15300 [Termitinemataceae bacterium]|nr:MAG: hypothetical protein Ta2G_15300 [Termitinemataceae bacterium]